MSPAPIRHKTLPIPEWPQADQERHALAFQEGDLFDEGPGARLAEASRKDFEFAWGRWLKFLKDTDPKALALEGPDRMTFARLRAFVEHLTATCTKSSILSLLSALSQAARLFYPEADLAVLKDIRSRIKPSPKKVRPIVCTSQLVDLGVELMARAEVGGEGMGMVDRAILYRDGLLIVLTALRILRRRNLWQMTLGEHLRKEGGRWVLLFDRFETKNRHPLATGFPMEHAHHLERYLDYWRPIIPGAGSHQWVWASPKGGRLSICNLNAVVVRHTTRKFGFRVNLHRFRHSAITTFAYQAPDQIAVGSALLHHASPNTAPEHYNLASTVQASDKLVEFYQKKRCSG